MRMTVFTPTYNRAYIIENLYRSLQRQTFRDFEWVVVDDGSEDGTEILINGWIQEEHDFPIRYYKKVNGGKYKAINYGLDLARGDLFFTVDSDDYLTDDALQLVDEWEKNLPTNEKFCGVAGNMDIDYPERPRTNTYIEGTILDRYKNIHGERATVFYTEVFRKYKFPEFDDEKFMTEAVTGNRMAHDGYRIRFYDDVIWIYEYKEDGLTKAGSSLFLNNPKGYGLWIREKTEFLNYSLKQKWKAYYSFTCDLLPKYSSAEIASFLGINRLVIDMCTMLYKLKRMI